MLAWTLCISCGFLTCGAVEPGRGDQAGKQPHPEALSAGLDKLGVLLAQHIPASAENPNELPDAPRFEL